MASIVPGIKSLGKQWLKNVFNPGSLITEKSSNCPGMDYPEIEITGCVPRLACLYSCSISEIQASLLFQTAIPPT